MLKISVGTVSSVFEEQRIDRRRRLGYGKYKQVQMNLTLAYLCAESSVPGAMLAFHYRDDIGKVGRYIDTGLSSQNGAMKQQATADVDLNNYLFGFSFVMMLLIWLRRKQLAEPDLQTVDLLTS